MNSGRFRSWKRAIVLRQRTIRLSDSPKDFHLVKEDRSPAGAILALDRCYPGGGVDTSPARDRQAGVVGPDIQEESIPGVQVNAPETPEVGFGLGLDEPRDSSYPRPRTASGRPAP